MSFIYSVDRVTDHVTRMRTLMANLYFIGTADAWLLVDGGLNGFANTVIRTAENLFDEAARPRAILLTHGHFDHRGTLSKLIERWDVPVFAHPEELPYLTGEKDYPPPEPRVGKGFLALMSFTYPAKAIDLGTRVQVLPSDGTIPEFPEWRWIHTPGHTEGHVSLFRDRDRTLIAGDAFVTTKQEALTSVAVQKPEVHGPPAYFTLDWHAARRSVEMLAALHPAIAATGHGKPMRGNNMMSGLRVLVDQFDEIVVPRHGRYVEDHAQMINHARDHS